MLSRAFRSLDEEFATNELCLEWLKNQRYPEGIRCQVCGRITRHHRISKRACYSCDNCGNQVYPTAGTIFYKSPTPLKTWFNIIRRMVRTNNAVSARDIQREYGVTYKTAWRMVHKIATFFAADAEPIESERNKTGASAGDKTGTDAVPQTGNPAAGDCAKTGVPAITSNPKDYYWKRDRTARLLKMQILLWQNPQGLKPEEIARKCFISKRTAYRDLKALESELGVPVWEEGARRGMAEGYSLPPLTFTLTEAINVFIASRLLQKYSHLYNPSLAATFMKLNTIIPQPLKKQIQNSMEYLERQPRDARKISNLNKLTQAWLSQHQLQIQYHDLFGTEQIETTIEPYFVEPVSTGRSVFVIAYCHLKKSIYAYKLDRIIGHVTLLPETYEIPPDFNAMDYIDSAWGIYADEALISVKLHFKPTVSRAVMATIWHPSQASEPQDDGSVIVTFNVRNTIDFRSWVFGWGNEVEVIEPATFREQVAQIVKELMDTYSGGVKLPLASTS